METILVCKLYNLGVEIGGCHRNFKYFYQSYNRSNFYACAIKWSILVYFDTYKSY